MSEVKTDQLIQSIKEAYAMKTADMEVTSVESVWSPTIETDEQLADSVAGSLLDRIENQTGELNEDMREAFLAFGAAVGSVCLRQLFTPFQADKILVQYTNESELNQNDAIARLAYYAPTADSRRTILDAAWPRRNITDQ